jgi:hypothetical protein
MVGYLAPGQGADAASVEPGEPLTLPAPADATRVIVTDPQGQATTLTPENNQVIYTGTDALGVYTVRVERDGSDPIERAIVVNLQDANESQVEPRKELDLQQVGGQAVAQTQERSARSEFWRSLAAFALAVLVIEWLVYQRSALAWLRNRIRGSRLPMTR